MYSTGLTPPTTAQYTSISKNTFSGEVWAMNQSIIVVSPTFRNSWLWL